MLLGGVGATQWVQMVEILVTVNVDTEVVVWTMALPEEVKVAVTGQIVVVSYTISVVRISWVDTGGAGTLGEGADDFFGATHLVQIVEMVVIVTVEMVDDVCVVVWVPDVTVAVIGQTVVVS